MSGRRLGILSALVVLSSSPVRANVPGADHHLGDQGFIAVYGRAPVDGADPEDVRMRTHLAFVYDWLAQRPATSPAYAARREQLLGYLGDYVALGVTPINSVLPWRNPVFIDEHDQICAVGYLIERSEGLALAATIRDQAAYRLLEDIDTPGLAEWVETSGFTLDELASIQPGYLGPWLQRWQNNPLDLIEPDDVAASEYICDEDGVCESDAAWEARRKKRSGKMDPESGVTGTMIRGRMEGRWTVDHGSTTGNGLFLRGAATWMGFEHGRLAARGPYRNNQPDGRWQIYHPQGAVAAEGRFSDGVRVGPWAFYYEDGKVMARGSFDADGDVTGTWRHYAANGNRLATTSVGTAGWSEYFEKPFEGGMLVRQVGGARHVLLGYDGIQAVRIDGMHFYSFGGEVLCKDKLGTFSDDTGRLIENGRAGWHYARERLTARFRRAARLGDTFGLSMLASLSGESGEEDDGLEEPGEAGPMSDKRLRAFERAHEIMCTPPETESVAESVAAVTTPADHPRPVSDEVLEDAEIAPDGQSVEDAVIEDDPEYCGLEYCEEGVSTVWDSLRVSSLSRPEWPHVDRLFERMFRTLPNFQAP